MSGYAVVNYVLSQDADLTAVVPGEQIVSGDLPLGATLPGVSVRSLSEVPRYDVENNPATRKLWTERVQVTVVASSYDSKKTIIKLVKAALKRTRGTVNGIDVDSLKIDSTGPDLDDNEAGIYQQSLDCIVKFYQ